MTVLLEPELMLTMCENFSEMLGRY